MAFVCMCPPRLRHEVFSISHGENHSGIRSTIQRIKLSAWWPGMDADIREMVQRCIVCSKLRSKTARDVHVWPDAVPFQRTHMDWAYVKEVGNVFIILDADSGWIEAFLVRDRTSNSVIKCLRTVFTKFGVPEVIVTDNATEFVSGDIND